MKVTQLDDMFGTPARVAIMATTATLPNPAGVGRWTFTALRQETGLADGNLHVQTRKLTSAGYLNRQRMRHGNRVVTCFDLTSAGRRSLQRYIDLLRMALVDESDFRRLAGTKAESTDADDSRVW